MKIFYDYPHLLAEGPLWLPRLQAFFWVDIVEQRVCGKNFSDEGEQLDFELKLEVIPTALIHDSNSDQHIWILTDQGLLHWQPEKNELQLQFDFELPQTHRTNDAGVDSAGNLWIGVMEKKPTGKNGWVFVIDEYGRQLSRIGQVGIPNTFCYLRSKDSMLISDSYQQLTFEVSCAGTNQRSVISDFAIWQNLGDTVATPDGGCVDEREHVWNAHWDGNKIRRLSPAGHTECELQVPAKQVTSCCFGGPDQKHILITTAADGLINNESSYSAHGKIFITEVIGHKGTLPNGFGMKVNT